MADRNNDRGRPTKRLKIEIPEIIKEDDFENGNLWIMCAKDWLTSIRKIITNLPLSRGAELQGPYLIEVVLSMTGEGVGRDSPLQLFDTLCGTDITPEWLKDNRKNGTVAWNFCKFVHHSVYDEILKRAGRESLGPRTQDINSIFKGTLDMFCYGIPPETTKSESSRTSKCYLYSSLIAGLTIKAYSFSMDFQTKSKGMGPDEKFMKLKELLPGTTKKYFAFRTCYYCLNTDLWTTFDESRLKLPDNKNLRKNFMPECFDHLYEIEANVEEQSQDVAPLPLYIPTCFEGFSDACQDLSQEADSQTSRIGQSDSELETLLLKQKHLQDQLKQSDEDILKKREQRDLQLLSLKTVNCNKSLMSMFWRFYRQYAHVGDGKMDPVSFMAHLQVSAVEKGFLATVEPVEMTEEDFWIKFAQDGTDAGVPSLTPSKIEKLKIVRLGGKLDITAQSRHATDERIITNVGDETPSPQNRPGPSGIKAPPYNANNFESSQPIIVNEQQDYAGPGGRRSRTNTGYRNPTSKAPATATGPGLIGIDANVPNPATAMFTAGDEAIDISYDDDDESINLDDPAGLGSMNTPRHLGEYSVPVPGTSPIVPDPFTLFTIPVTLDESDSQNPGYSTSSLEGFGTSQITSHQTPPSASGSAVPTEGSTETGTPNDKQLTVGTTGDIQEKAVTTSALDTPNPSGNGATAQGKADSTGNSVPIIPPGLENNELSNSAELSNDGSAEGSVHPPGENQTSDGGNDGHNEKTKKSLADNDSMPASSKKKGQTKSGNKKIPGMCESPRLRPRPEKHRPETPVKEKAAHTKVPGPSTIPLEKIPKMRIKLSNNNGTVEFNKGTPKEKFVDNSECS